MQNTFLSWDQTTVKCTVELSHWRHEVTSTALTSRLDRAPRVNIRGRSATTWPCERGIVTTIHHQQENSFPVSCSAPHRRYTTIPLYQRFSSEVYSISSMCVTVRADFLQAVRTRVCPGPAQHRRIAQYYSQGKTINNLTPIPFVLASTKYSKYIHTTSSSY